MVTYYIITAIVLWWMYDVRQLLRRIDSNLGAILAYAQITIGDDIQKGVPEDLSGYMVSNIGDDVNLMCEGCDSYPCECTFPNDTHD